MTDREHRLRERIDRLTDERDQALAELDLVRDRAHRQQKALREARQRRDHWRAVAARFRSSHERLERYLAPVRRQTVRARSPHVLTGGAATSQRKGV